MQVLINHSPLFTILALMAYSLDKAQILIVDDMHPMLSLTRSMLKAFGFKHIFVASNGQEAFDIVCKEDPDLIITDWIMEPMDGLELTRMIRRDRRAPNPYVPILLMTGFSAKNRVENARDAGATEFLVKPFSAMDLYKRVHQIIENPRQFVEVDEFFGPDRRRTKGRGFEGHRKRHDDPKDDIPLQDSDAQAGQDILKKLKEEARNIPKKDRER